MDNSALFTLNDLTVWYTKGKNVLSDYSITLGKNQIIGLIGFNGAGKTTFIKTMSGLIPGYDVKSVSFHGKPVSFQDMEFKRNRYVVFAEDHSFSYFTFREYLSYVAASYNKKLPDVTSLIQGFHFEEYTNVLMKELSTGNLKKAYLITAFAIQPPLLLLDEPVNGLDFQSTEYLYQKMNEYRKYGTILFSSHILESICLTADQVLVLDDGTISQKFTRNEINASRIREVLGKKEDIVGEVQERYEGI